MPDCSRVGRAGSAVNQPTAWGTESAAFLRIAVATTLVGACAALIAMRMAAPDQTVRVFAPALLPLIAMTGWFFLQRDRIQTATYVLSFGLWAGVTGIALFTGGGRAPAVVVYPVIILMVAWVISARAALTAGGLTVTATLALLWVETRGLLPQSLPSSSAMHAADQVIAEGVETVAHGTLLLQLGCELAQGYGIARPMPAQDLPGWSATWKPDPAWRTGNC